MYSLTEPHSFQVQGVYQNFQLDINKLEDRPNSIWAYSSVIKPGLYMVEREEDVPHVFDLDDQKRAHLHYVWGVVPYQTP